MMIKARMTTLIRILGVVAVVMAFLAIPMVTGQSVAHAQASCGGTTDHVNANFDVAVPSTSNNSGNFNCIDGIGNQGAAVKELQMSLNFCRKEHLTVDGIYGTLTSNAMKRAQQALGVPQDGIYGPQTRRAGFLFEGVTIQHPRLACGTAGF
ncbi:MAG TPA: peptidoglycan-binding domain-containing protein [Ktedonobacteraceae bacterium]|nr:peptidoglycan-binding domain-containing protein [Ktedonobacteraceae bacterium]